MLSHYMIYLMDLQKMIHISEKHLSFRGLF